MIVIKRKANNQEKGVHTPPLVKRVYFSWIPYFGNQTWNVIENNLYNIIKIVD